MLKTKKTIYSTLPRAANDENIIEKCKNQVGQIVRIDVYDGFEGDVKVLAAEDEKIYVKIVRVHRYFTPRPCFHRGQRLWVEDWVV